MPSLSALVRLRPGAQPDFLDAVERLNAWHAELERRIASSPQELADHHKRLEDRRSRIESLSATKGTAAQLQEAKTAASPSENVGLSSAAPTDLRSSSSTAQN